MRRGRIQKLIQQERGLLERGLNTDGGLTGLLRYL